MKWNVLQYSETKCILEKKNPLIKNSNKQIAIKKVRIIYKIFCIPI